MVRRGYGSCLGKEKDPKVSIYRSRYKLQSVRLHNSVVICDVQRFYL